MMVDRESRESSHFHFLSIKLRRINAQKEVYIYFRNIYIIKQYSPPFSQLYYSHLPLNFQVSAHLRVTNANGLIPVKDRAGGTDRNPATIPDHPLITLQRQVTFWFLIDWWILWTQDKNLWVNMLTITWPCTKLLSVHLNLHVCTVDFRCSRSFSGYYMSVNLSQESTQSEARLQSPQLSPSSPYCQIL